jgi:hypothetical protein
MKRKLLTTSAIVDDPARSVTPAPGAIRFRLCGGIVNETNPDASTPLPALFFAMLSCTAFKRTVPPSSVRRRLSCCRVASHLIALLHRRCPAANGSHRHLSLR